MHFNSYHFASFHFGSDHWQHGGPAEEGPQWAGTSEIGRFPSPFNDVAGWLF